MNYIIFLLLTLMLFSFGVHLGIGYQIYIAISLIGLILLMKKKTYLSSALKSFLILSCALALYTTAHALFIDWQLLFTWRFDIYKILLLTPFFAAACSYMLDQFQDTGAVFWNLLLLHALSAIFFCTLLIYNYDTLVRGVGLLQQPINRGNLGMLTGLMALPAIFTLKPYALRALALLIFCCGLLVSLISQSRGGWLALPLATITLAGFLLYYNKKKSALFLMGGFIGITAVIGALSPYHRVDERLLLAVHELTSYWANDADAIHSSAGLRLFMWKISLHAIFENFWLGWGWGQYPTAQEAIINSGVVPAIRNVGHPHNHFALIFVETGLIGILLYITWLLYPCIKALQCIKKTPPFQIGIIAICIVVLTESLIEFSLTDDTLAIKDFTIIIITMSILFLHITNVTNNKKTELNK